MKKSLSIAVVLFIFSMSARSNVLIVQDGAACSSCSPAIYGTIQSAVTAANSGDTIFIRPKAGNLPYVENVAIGTAAGAGKNLDIVPVSNDSVWYCQGTWTINPSAGMLVDIVGMNNVAGSIVAGTNGSTAPTATNRCTVRLLGGSMGSNTTTGGSGSISFNADDYDVYVYGMKIYNSNNNPTIYMRHGSIIGDSIVYSGAAGQTSAHAIYIQSEGSVPATSDTCFILGNVIWMGDATGNGSYNNYSNIAAIYWNSNAISFDIRNNFIVSNSHGIYVNNTKATVAPINRIYNNTIYLNGTYSSLDYSPEAALYFTTQVGSAPYGSIEVQNNAIARVTSTAPSTYAFYIANANLTINTYYNYTDSRFTANSGTPAVSVGNSFGGVTGIPVVATGSISATYPPATTGLGYYSAAFTGINGGNPAYAYCNLGSSYSATGTYNGYTVNTVGCYGGQFSIQNFFPMNTGASRTWATPGNIPNTMNNGFAIPTYLFKASSFDR